LPLYIDGARLGYGLASPQNDCSLQDIARLADIFYIGGTKQGALFGEAVVITNPALQKDFRYFIKQKGGMLAKGRLLGIQFKTLFTDNLYFNLAKKTVEQALLIRQAFQKKGISFFFDSYTNQQFPILTAAQREYFAPKYKTSFWQPLDGDKAVVRFCTSWATTDAAVAELVADIERM
jgi:threonine aldolase